MNCITRYDIPENERMNHMFCFLPLLSKQTYFKLYNKPQFLGLVCFYTLPLKTKITRELKK